jgi:hypothetical protein
VNDTYRWEDPVLWIGDASYKNVAPEIHDIDLPQRREPVRIRKFWVLLQYPWAVSVIWGTGTYSSNSRRQRPPLPFMEEPFLAELAIVNGDGPLGDVAGYVPPEEANEIIAVVSQWGPDDPGRPLDEIRDGL